MDHCLLIPVRRCIHRVPVELHARDEDSHPEFLGLSTFMPAFPTGPFFRTMEKVSCELRAATASDEPFLWEMLYLALFVPAGELPHPRSVLGDPAVARYVEGWGMRGGDSDWIALVDGAPLGAAWLRCFPASEPGYGFVDERTPELSIAVLRACRIA